jgi:hypothetical protein
MNNQLLGRVALKRYAHLLTLREMEQCALKNINNCLNANIYSYLETSGDQSSILYFNGVHFFNTSLNETSVAA